MNTFLNWGPQTPAGFFIENLAQLNAPVQFSDPDVAENTLIAATIPAGTLGAGGRGRVSAKLSGRLAINNTLAGVITLRVRLGSSVLATEAIDVTLQTIGTYWYVLTLDYSGRRFFAFDIIAGELLGQFQVPQGFQVATGTWGVRQVSGIPAPDPTIDQPFSVTAQFDAGVAGTWVTEYAHVDRVRS